jgi:FKBP-type peptidyl-prolyl cis-trans isomerase SlyD
MKIGDNSVVSLDYVLTLDSGEEVDRSESGDPLVFLFGAGRIITGLEQALEGKETGFSGRIVVEPEEGYGTHREELLRTVPRHMFPEKVDLAPGTAFEAEGPHGAMRFIVRSVEDELVTVDLNHPLAGQRLTFEVTVAGVREATPQDWEDLASDSCGCGCEGEDESAGCGGGSCGSGGCGRG